MWWAAIIKQFANTFKKNNNTRDKRDFPKKGENLIWLTVYTGMYPVIAVPNSMNNRNEETELAPIGTAIPVIPVPGVEDTQKVPVGGLNDSRVLTCISVSPQIGEKGGLFLRAILFRKSMEKIVWTNCPPFHVEKHSSEHNLITYISLVRSVD